MVNGNFTRAASQRGLLVRVFGRKPELTLQAGVELMVMRGRDLASRVHVDREMLVAEPALRRLGRRRDGPFTGDLPPK